MMEQKRVLSGMRPTGRFHLGNYMGAFQNWVALQNEYKCFYMVADWHALTTAYEDPTNIEDNIIQMLIDWLSLGLDPEKSTIFIQSDVKEHAELHLLFSMIIPVSWLERCPTYKDQINQLQEKNIATYGFLGYPCLQAADILIYKADFVPVGEDQLPHLELTREVARRFNYLYGKIFPEPQALLTKESNLIGIDGRKMSKSYGNTISFSDSAEEIRHKVRMMITDPQRIKKNDPGNPEVCTVFSYQKIFNNNLLEEIEMECKAGQIGCVDCKKRLAETMLSFVEPIREKRNYYERNTDVIFDIINEGAKKAREIARDTLEEVRKVMKISYRW